MRRLALMLVFAAGPALAEVPLAADFAAANEKLLSGDAGAAIALYQHVAEQGVVARDLSYNLGVALARAGRSVEAIVAFEQTLRLDPSFADARTNLSVLRARFPKRGSAQDEAPTAVADVLEPLVAPFDPDVVALTTVLALTLCCAIFAARRLGKLRSMTAAAWVTFAVTLIGGTIALAQAVVRADPRAVVTATCALKDGPEPRFNDVATITAGERVRVQRSEGSYLEVRATDGVAGWIPAGDVTRL